MNHNMAGSRIALVTDHAAQVEALAEYLGQAQGKSLFVTGYGLIRDFLSLDTDGLLLAAVTRPEEVDAATQLVQDIRLQKLPPRVVLVEGTGTAVGRLVHLEPFVHRSLRWPDDSERLARQVRELGELGRPVRREFSDVRPDSLEE